jgi:multiple sugar transport system substrate-binding protein
MSDRLSRREFIKRSGMAALSGGLLYAVGGSIARPRFSYAGKDKEGGVKKGTSGDPWRQYEGTKLIFMSENTPPSYAIKTRAQEFYDLTGMEIEIRQDTLSTVQEKVGIDLKGGTTSYHLNYAQDKPLSTMFADYWADYYKFINDDTLPQDPDGYGPEVWGPNWLDTTGFFYTRDRLVALPYDNAIAVTMYRQDLFEKYSKQFEAEYGYPLEFTKETTWKNVLDMGKFFNKPSIKEVEYGVGFQALEGWAGQLCYQRILFSHGQWEEWDFEDPYVGTRNPGPCKWGDDQSLETLSHMKELFNVAHPESLSWNWSGVNTGYTTGKIAICFNYGEFAASVEDPDNSVAAGGRTAYALCPKGEPSWIVNGGRAVNGTNYGIGGIAINGNLSEDMQRAAFIFAIYATSAKVQKEVLKELGGTPTRMKVLNDPEVKKAMTRPTTMPNALTYPPSLEGCTAPNDVPGPKIPKFNEYMQTQTIEISKFLAGQQSADAAARTLKRRLDQMHGV